LESLVTVQKTFWSGKRVYLTGHTGFKGGWLAYWLSLMGATVRGYALAPDSVPSLFEKLRLGQLIDSEIADIRDGERVLASMSAFKPDVVLHLAAQALVHSSYERPSETFATNTMGLINVLEAARGVDSVRVFVNVTSDKCYENREWLWAYREDEAMGGSDPYSASKGCAELITASWRRSFFSKAGKQLASGRAGNVIGGGDWSRDRLVPDCIRAFSVDQHVLIRSPKATRPWQHVLEPLSGYLTLAEHLWTEGEAFSEGWNFGPSDADAIPVDQVVEILTGLWGGKAAWRLDGNAFNREALLLRVDAAKSRARLNWRPRLDVRTALGWTVEWAKSTQAGEDARTVTAKQISSYESLGPAA
jgi:CDP-glucose 4,6-dehydratase